MPRDPTEDFDPAKPPTTPTENFHKLVYVPPNIPRAGRGRVYNDEEKVSIKQTYLDVYAMTNRKMVAYHASGVDHSTIMRWMRDDEEFREDEQSIAMMILEKLKDVAMSRATDGWFKPIYQKGEFMGYEWCYDSKLLMFMLRAYDPKTFAAKYQVDVSGADIVDAKEAKAKELLKVIQDEADAERENEKRSD